MSLKERSRVHIAIAIASKLCCDWTDTAPRHARYTMFILSVHATISCTPSNYTKHATSQPRNRQTGRAHTPHLPFLLLSHVNMSIVAPPTPQSTRENSCRAMSLISRPISTISPTLTLPLSPSLLLCFSASLSLSLSLSFFRSLARSIYLHTLPPPPRTQHRPQSSASNLFLSISPRAMQSSTGSCAVSKVSRHSRSVDAVDVLRALVKL